jgi:hypothetical protein
MKRLLCIALSLLLAGCPHTKVIEGTGEVPDASANSDSATSSDKIVPADSADNTEVPPAPPYPDRVKKFDDQQISDEDMEKICRDYPELVELALQGTQVTDAGLVHLQLLPKLRKIRLAKTAITDAGMKNLAKCETLVDIDVSQTKIGDSSVGELRALPRLRNLNLYLTHVTDLGLYFIGGQDFLSAAKIERLNLDKCPITDDGLPKLASLTKIKWIHLGGTAITDAGLAELAKFETLTEAIVTKTETTLEGIEKLREARPDMNVRDNVSDNVPQEAIDEAAELRKQLAPIREKGAGDSL